MQDPDKPPSDRPAAHRGFSFAEIPQLLGASSFVAVATSLIAMATWGLNNIISAKSNQQQQLNTFINTISDFMIQNNLDGQSSGTPQVPAVTRAARGYALNTLNTLDGVIFIEDKPKKVALLKFLYDSELIGFCKDTTAGNERFKTFNKCFDTRIKLKDARLPGLNFRDVGPVLAGIDLSGSTASASNFDSIDLTHSKFRRARLKATSFKASSLDGADFSSAYLVNANLANATIDHAILDGAQICGADLRGVSGFETASLKRITFDSRTQLPKGARERLIENNGYFAETDQVGTAQEKTQNDRIKPCTEIVS